MSALFGLRPLRAAGYKLYEPEAIGVIGADAPEGLRLEELKLGIGD